MNRIDVLNRALTRIGAAALQSDATPAAAPYVQAYEQVIEALLALYPWSFARGLARLNRLVAPPGAHWAYAFDLPPAMLGSPRAVFDSASLRTPLMDYELQASDTARLLLTNASDVWLLYTKRADPGLWPAHFREVAILLLAAEYALAVREDMGLRNQLRTDALGPPQMLGEGGLLAQVKSLDSQAQPSPQAAVGANPLIDARF